MGPRLGFEPLAGPHAASPVPCFIAPSEPTILAHRDARLRGDIGQRALCLRVSPEAAGRDLLLGGRIEALPALTGALVVARLPDGAHEPGLRPEGEHALDAELALAGPRASTVGGGERGGAARGM